MITLFEEPSTLDTHMDISKTIAELKKDPEFQKNVGMVLVHNGVVRGWSREGRKDVDAVDIVVDRDRLDAICRRITSYNVCYTKLLRRTRALTTCSP